MRILKQPDSFCFTSGVGDIVIAPDANTPIDFQIKMGDIEVLPTETYYRNADGVICIKDIGNVLSIWLRNEGPTAYLLAQQINVATFSFIYNGSQTVSHTVMRSDVDFDQTAAVFCSTHFLTLMFGTKQTVIGRREILAFYDASATSAVVIATYLNGSTVETTTLEKNALGNGSVKYLDVSPKLFNSPDKILLTYQVTCGMREMKYIVVPDNFLQQTHFVYRNCFGVEDTFTAIGEASSEGKYERYYATFSGGYKNFKRKNLKEYKVDTGVLSQALAYAVDDLFSSEEIWLYDESGLIKEIVILDQKVQRSSLHDEAPRFEFTYRLVQNNQRYKTAISGRIFDATFDRSFN